MIYFGDIYFVDKFFNATLVDTKLILEIIYNIKAMIQFTFEVYFIIIVKAIWQNDFIYNRIFKNC